MTAKKAFGKIHLWLGLASGLIVFVVALTGSILVFEEELELLFHRKQLKVGQVLSHRKSYDELATVVKVAYPGKNIKGFNIYPDPERSVLFSVGKSKEELLLVGVDQYTGKVLGHQDHNKRFFTIVLKLHRYLLMGTTGKVITGVSCLIFIVMLISGLIIWWPATKAAIRQRFKVKWKAKFKRVNWDFHAVFGFYSFIFLLIIASTGLVWSYPWVNKMIFVLSDGKPQVKYKAPENISPENLSNAGIYEKVVAATNREYPYKGETRVSVPLGDSLSINVFKENKEVKLANVASAAWFDRRSGEVLRVRPYEKESTGMKVRRLIYPIHTGSAYGWPTKIIAFVVSLFAATLPVTGTLIWLGRIRKKKRARIAVKGVALRKNSLEVAVAEEAGIA
jgi:uncharacterized iron-regulated membrane protein